MIVSNLKMSEQYNREMRYDSEQHNNERENFEIHHIHIRYYLHPKP